MQDNHQKNKIDQHGAGGGESNRQVLKVVNGQI